MNMKKMKHRSVAPLLMAVLVVLAAGSAAGQDAPRTPWGAPDLQGIWDFKTATPLQRPEDRGEQAFLTEEEAANIEQEAVDRNVRLWEAAPRRTEAGGNVGGYNNFWLDFGTTVIESRRTSLIVDPPDGRIPALTDEGQRRTDERQAYREAHPADTYLDRSAFDRCILGFNTGPPMTPGFYNQHMQLFQTPDHVVVLNEMVHDARIIPLDGSPRPGIESWTGESRGQWEGDTLVVETIDFSDKHGYRGSTKGPSPRRALHARRRGHAPLRVHHQRPRHLDGALDRAGPDAGHGAPALRVRLPRGQLRHAQHHGRRAPGGAAAGERAGLSVRPQRRRPKAARGAAARHP